MNNQESKSKSSRFKQRSGKGLSVQRLVRHWRGLLWIVGMIVAFVMLVLSVQWWMRSIGDEVSGWWSKIEDPTERGGAYIATAIAAHAVVMAFKTMSRDRIKVDLKKEDSQTNNASVEESPKTK